MIKSVTCLLMFVAAISAIEKRSYNDFPEEDVPTEIITFHPTTTRLPIRPIHPTTTAPAPKPVPTYPGPALLPVATYPAVPIDSTPVTPSSIPTAPTPRPVIMYPVPVAPLPIASLNPDVPASKPVATYPIPLVPYPIALNPDVTNPVPDAPASLPNPVPDTPFEDSTLPVLPVPGPITSLPTPVSLPPLPNPVTATSETKASEASETEIITPENTFEQSLPFIPSGEAPPDFPNPGSAPDFSNPRSAPSFFPSPPQSPRNFDGDADAEPPVTPIITKFSCDGRKYGYYGDTEDCTVYIICNPQPFENETIEYLQFNERCAPGTVFNQPKLTCTLFEEAPPCITSPDFYGVNDEFGQIPTCPPEA